MDADSTNAPTKKIKIKTPSWATWKQRGNCSLGDAVALSLNFSPSALLSVKKNNKRKYSAYLTRLKTAGLEAYDGGRIKVLLDHPENGVETKSRIVSLASFVSFALSQDSWNSKLPEGFIQLNDSQISSQSDSQVQDFVNSPHRVKRKSPDKFVAALMRLFVEIAKRSERANLTFNISEMPGVKEDLKSVAQKYDKDLEVGTSRTFSDYISGLCQFKQGASSNDFYMNLFPEYFKSSTK